MYDLYTGASLCSPLMPARGVGEGGTGGGAGDTKIIINYLIDDKICLPMI